jgi:hypothetical protein
MIINEILTEASIFDERTLKNTSWKNPTQIIKWLKANGFKKIGKGYYANVYAKPGHNRIVKISNQQDDCWISFAHWAMTKTNNKYLPKIPWIKRWQGKREGIPQEFFVTIIERLQPLTNQALAQITDPAVLLGLYNYADLNSESYQTIENTASKSPGMKDLIHIDVEDYANHPFIKILHAVEKIGKKCRTDLHAGNFMVRADGTIVVTDPIAFGY